MVGIQNTADIKLTVTLDEKGLDDLRKAMETINASLETQTAVKQFAALEKTMKNLKKELAAAKKETASFKKEQKAAAQEGKRATDTQVAAVRKMRAERRNGVAATKASIAAEKQISSMLMNSKGKMFAYINVLQKRYGAERALILITKNKANMERAAVAAANASRTAALNNTKAHNQYAQSIRAVRAARVAVAPATRTAVAAQKKLDAIVKTSSAGMKTYIAGLVKRVGAERALAMVQKASTNAQERSAAAAKKAAAAALGVTVATGKQRIRIQQTVGDLAQYHRKLTMSAEAMSRFQRGLKTSRTVIGRFSNALSKAEHDMDALFRASFRLSIVGFTLKRFADNIIRWGTAILDVFGEFEFTMLRAAGALEIWEGALIDGTNGFKVLREELLGLTNELVLFAANDVAEALYFWGSATGQVVRDTEDLENTMSSLGTIMKAASMTNTDYEATIKGVYSIITQFYSGSLEYTTEVTEKLFLSTQKTAAEFTDLIQSFKMVGPVAAQVGADFDMVNEAFGKLSDLGLRGSMAGRGLRQMFIQIARPSGPAQKKLSELFEENENNAFGGQTFYDVTFPEGEFVGITEHVKNLAKATEHLNSADRVQAIARITTANSLPLTIALMAQQRNEMLGLTEAQDKFKDSDPTEFFRKNWAALSHSWNAAKASLERMIETIKIDLGASMAEALKPLITRFNVFLEQVDRFVRANPQITEMVTNFAAIVAVGSMVAGTLLVVGGALVGLFAAMRLIWQASEEWRGSLGRLIGFLGLLFAVVVENFDYLHAAAIKIIDNLTEAFGDLGAATSDFGSVFEKIMRPAKEILGLFVRLTADLIVFTSEMLKFASSIGVLKPILDTLIFALSVLVSAKIVGGLFALAARYLFFTTAVSASSVATASVTGLSVAMKLLVSGKMILGLKALAAAVFALGVQIKVALGPLGWAALVVSAGLMIMQFPEVSRGLDEMNDSLKGLNAELGEAVGYFDLAGPGVERLAEAFGNSLPALGLITQEMASFKEAQAAILGLDLADLERSTSPGNLISKAYSEATDEAKAAYDALFDLSGRPNPLGNMAGEFREASKDALRASIDYVTEWTEGHKRLTDAILIGSREIEVSGLDYGRALIKIDPSRLIEFYDPTSGVVQHGAEAIDELVNSFILSMPDKLTLSEMQPLLKRWNAIQSTVFEGFTFREAVSILGDRLGEESSTVANEVNAMLEKHLSDVDFYVLRDFLTSEQPLLGGANPLDLIGNTEQYGDSQLILQALMKRFETLGGKLEEEGNLALADIEKRLKNTLEVMAVNLLMNAMPDLQEVSNQIQALGLDNTDASYKAMAELFLEQFADGKTLAEMVTDGSVKGTAVSTLKNIAEALVNAGFGGDALASYLEAEAAEAGSDAVEATRRGAIAGMVEAAEMKFDKESMKKLLKLGSPVDMIRKAGEEWLKSRRAGYGKGQTAASRAESDRYFQNLNKQRNLALEAAAKAVNKVKGRRQTTKANKEYLEQTLPVFDKLPQGQKNKVFKIYNELFKNNKTAARRLKNKSTREFREQWNEYRRNIKSIMGETEPYDPSGTIGGGVAPPTAPYDPSATIGGGAGGKVVKSKGKGKGAGGGTKKEPFSKKVSKWLDAAGKSTLIAEGAITFAEETIIKVGEAITASESEVITDAVSKVWWATGQEGSAATIQAVETGTSIADSGTTAMGEAISGEASQKRTLKSTKDLLNDTASLAIIPASTMAKPIGSAWVQGIANGISDNLQAIIDAVKKVTAALEGQSPPKVGPLKEIDKWGENVGNAWSEGLAKGINRGEEVLKNSQAFSNAEITHKGKREVTVKLEVSSPDGTANRQKQGEIRRGALEALTVAGLEHYVTVV